MWGAGGLGTVLWGCTVARGILDALLEYHIKESKEKVSCQILCLNLGATQVCMQQSEREFKDTLRVSLQLQLDAWMTFLNDDFFNCHL